MNIKFVIRIIIMKKRKVEFHSGEVHESFKTFENFFKLKKTFKTWTPLPTHKITIVMIMKVRIRIRIRIIMKKRNSRMTRA